MLNVATPAARLSVAARTALQEGCRSHFPGRSPCGRRSRGQHQQKTVSCTHTTECQGYRTSRKKDYNEAGKTKSPERKVLEMDLGGGLISSVMDVPSFASCDSSRVLFERNDFSRSRISWPTASRTARPKLLFAAPRQSSSSTCAGAKVVTRSFWPW